MPQVPQDEDWYERKVRERSGAGAVPPPPEPEDWYESKVRDRAAAFNLSVEEGLKIDPGKAARAVRLQGRTGLPADMIAENLDELEAEVKKSDFNVEKFRRSSPIVAKWISESPYYAGVAQEDILKLGNLEQLLSRPRHLWPLPEAEIQKQAAKAAKRRAQEYAQRTESLKAQGLYDGSMELHTPEQLEKIYLEEELAERRKEEAFIASDEKIGFWEKVGKRARENPAFWAPFVSSVPDAAKYWQLYTAAKAYNAGTATEDEEEFLFRFGRLAEAEERRGTGKLGDVAGVVAELPAFAGELALTSGAYSAGKLVAEKTIREGLKKVLKGRARSVVRQAVGGVGGAAVQTPFASAGRIAGETLERMTPGIGVTEDEAGQLKPVLGDTQDGFAEAFVKAVGSSYVENLSERTGVVLTGMTGPIKRAVMQRWLRINPDKGVAGFLKAVGEKTGWHGVLGEVFEERVGEVLRTPIDGYQAPTWDQLATELLAFGIPGAGGAALSTLGRRKPPQAPRTNPEIFKAMGQAMTDLKMREASPEATREVAKVVAKGKDVYVPVDEFATYFQTQKDEAGNPVDPREVAQELSVSREAYDNAVRLKTDIVIPGAEYLVKIAPTEHNAFFQKAARWLNPLEVNEREAKEEDAHREAQAKAAEPQAAEAQPATLGERIRETAAKVGESVKRALSALGLGKLAGLKGISDKDLEYYSKVVEQSYKQRGEILGVDPLELFEGERLQLGLAEEPAKGKAYDQPAAPEPISEETRLALEGKFGVEFTREVASQGIGEREAGSLLGAEGLPDARERLARLSRQRRRGEALQDLGGPNALAGESITRRDPDGARVRFHLEPASRFVYEAPPETKQALEAIGQGAPAIHELKPSDEAAETFHEAISGSKRSSEFGAAVYVYTPREYRGMRLFMTEDGSAGFALKGDDIVSVFRNSSVATSVPSVDALLLLAVREGGRRLDAFDTVLPHLYGMHGFVVASRTPWDDSFAPEGWDKKTFSRWNAGEPDVVYMVYDPNEVGRTYGGQAEGQRVQTYEEAVKIQKAKVEEIRDRHQDIFYQTGEQGRRGFSQFPKGRIQVAFTKAADFSTFLHEMGHVWLETLGRDVATLRKRDPATLNEKQRTFLARADELLKWLGAESFEKLTREQHEKFAEEAETYFATGKAPSSALKKAFQAFKDWLLEIYGRLRGQTEVAPEVSNVLDRLLASEEEIALARAEQALESPILDLAAQVMGEKKGLDAAAAIENVQRAASERINPKILAKITREKEAFFKDEVERAKKDIAPEVNQRKEYVAYSILAEGKFPDGTPAAGPLEGLKLNVEAVDAYGKTARKTLPKAMLSQEGGTTPDLAAELLGFTSGDELIKTLSNLEDREALIDRLARERVHEQYGDILEDGSLFDEVMKAVHTPEQAKVLRMEAELLASQEFAQYKKLAQAIYGQVKSSEEYFKEAEAEIARKTARGVNPKLYQRAEQKAGREAVAHFEAGRWQEAFDAKVRQLENHERYRAAVAALERAEETRKFMRKFEKPLKRQQLGKAGGGYLEQIDAIMERFEFRRVSGRRVEKRQSLREWAERQAEEQGVPPTIPEKLLDEAYKTNYQDVSFEELEAIRDTVRHLDHLSTLKNQLLAAHEKREFEAVVDGAVKSIRENYKGKLKEPRLGEKTPGEMRIEKLAEGVMALRKLSGIVKELDGGENGYLWNLLIRPLNRRQEVELVRRQEVGKRIRDLFRAAYSDLDLAVGLRRKVFVPEIQASLSKLDMLVVFLNSGNAENLAALQDGYGWSDAQVKAILNRPEFEKKDAELGQKILDLLEEFFPEVNAHHKGLTGLDLEKVDAQPIATRHGTFRGGYYPLGYLPDPAKPHKSIGEEIEDAQRGMAAMRYAAQHHRKHRVGSGGRKVRLDIGVLDRHVSDVIHDLTHYNWLVDAHRLMRSPEIVAAIKETVGETGLNEIRATIDVIAANGRAGKAELSGVANFLASRVRSAALMGRLRTALRQLTGIFPTLYKLGPKWTMRGFASLVGGGQAQIGKVGEWIENKDPFMKGRSVSQSREAVEIFTPGRKAGYLGYASEKLDALERLGFAPLVALQYVVDKVTWLGGYQKALAELGIENAKSDKERAEIDDKAVALAAQVVRDTQGSGLLADQPRILRAKGVVRLLTVFKTFAVNRLNLFMETAIPAIKTRDPKLIFKAAVSLTVNYVIPMIVWMEILKALKGGDDDEERNLASEWGLGTAKELLGDVPFFAEAVPTVGALQGKYADYEGPAGFSAFAEGVDLAQQVRQWENDEALLRSIIKMTGYATGLPSGQFEDTLFGWQAWEEGKAGPGAVLFGAPARGRR